MEPELPDGFFSGLTIWNSDLHAGPIKCLLDQFVQYGITVKAQIDFWHCGFFGMCKTDLKVFSFDDWRGFGLEPCPYSLRRKFFAAYKKDEEFAKVDAFICSHPVANCELFLPFNRTVILYLTTRLEQQSSCKVERMDPQSASAGFENKKAYYRCKQSI
eukprot:tig00000037_g10085.t1